MQAGMPVCAEPACPNNLSGHAGDSTERLASCNNTTLPQSFTQYLNTSFLGERQFIQVGPVNYTFFQFGPLGATATGTYHMLSIIDQFREVLPALVLLAYRPQHPEPFLSFEDYSFALHCMACISYWSHFSTDNCKTHGLLLSIIPGAHEETSHYFCSSVLPDAAGTVCWHLGSPV